MLPDAWVDELFARFTVRYGAEWLRKWDGVDKAALKADWATELAGFEARPEAIKNALNSLPADWPPTVGQFRALCLAAPLPKHAALPAPPANPEAAERLRALNVQIGAVDSKAWAYELRRRELACERLSAAQRAAWREALKGELRAEREAYLEAKRALHEGCTL